MKSQNGFAYENVVLEAIKSAGIKGVVQSTAGSNPNLPDADFKIENKIYNLEIKLDDKAQMGGSSITYDMDNKKFGLVADDIDPEIKEALFNTIQTKEKDLIKLIEFITHEERNLVVPQKFPLVCSKDTWERAQQNNLLVNIKIPCPIDFLEQHLLKKNVHYIQIGGKGLFHLGRNPAQLPIERLQGNFTVEIRTGRSGSKPHPKGFSMVTGAIRVQGRLDILNVASHYTLDTWQSIQKLLCEKFWRTTKLESPYECWYISNW